VLLVWLLFPLGLHMCTALRNIRYVFPLVPAFAVLLAVGLSSLGPRVRGAMAGLAASVGLLMLMVCSLHGESCPPLCEMWPDRLFRRLHVLPRPLNYLTACGPIKYTAPSCTSGMVLAPERRQLRRAGAWLEGRRDPRRPDLVLCTVHSINEALLIQRDHPWLRISVFDFGWGIPTRPVEGYRRYMLFFSQRLPPAARQRVHYQVPFRRVVPDTHDAVLEDTHLILVELRPGDSWPTHDDWLPHPH
jgi:hypothetical protein